MKTLNEIYSAYKIMPNLQAHQIRVASVAKLICENITIPIDTNKIMLTCLFHDMGNIIKFDLKHFPEFNEPEGLVYWENVKAAYIKKYGRDEHAAHIAIAHELALPDNVVTGINQIGFSELKKVLADTSIENKICSYADMRVVPFGVVSIGERLTEGRKRYAKKKQAFISEEFGKMSKVLQNIERQIFASCSIKPDDITDKNIESVVKSFQHYSLNNEKTPPLVE